jgi:hypothetical protein
MSTTSHTQHGVTKETCLDACTRCYNACQAAISFCLEQGGKHVEARHLKLLLECAAICRASTVFLIHRSEFHLKVCDVCAEVCGSCAASCEELGMTECAQACRYCAASCLETCEV